MESIKFTMEVSQDHVNFLDTQVRINHANNTMETDLYCKTTDSHNYLLYNSAHPSKCKKGIPYCQFLRIRRIIVTGRLRGILSMQPIRVTVCSHVTMASAYLTVTFILKHKSNCFFCI